MRSYQVVLVLKSGSEETRKKAVGFARDLLKGLKVTKEEDLGSKALAYKVKGELSAHYFNMKVEGEMIPADFEKKIMENDTILRHLVVRVQ